MAIKGQKGDGHDLTAKAVENGAVALVLEKPESIPPGFLGPVRFVANTREALVQLASQYFGNPSKDLFCFGVTGTNGKTSTTYMLEHVLNRMQIITGVLGTIDHHLLGHVWPTEVTTPDPISLQRRLREMKDTGARAVAMEVSSHALDQKRADGVHFNTVIFTNLTRDHLDYHANMELYFAAKQRLFTDLLWKTEKPLTFAVVNTDDEWGAKLRVSSNASLWTFGQNSRADFSFKILKMSFSQTEFEIKTPLGMHKSFIPMCGIHNIYNAVGVVAAAANAGVPPLAALQALQSFTGVPGRLQGVENRKSLHVFVDYAHTPDALMNVLQSLICVRKELQENIRIWTVFGCGGDRDKGKRPEMAKIAEKYSDFVVVTSDNPRSENPEQILQDIWQGFSKPEKNITMEVDRKKAIEWVLAKATAGDVILIAGKGHEDYQTIGVEKRHFSDAAVVREFE